MVTVTLNDEDGGVVKEPVQSAEQIGVSGEVFGPGVRLPVAGEDHAARTRFAAAPVDQVKEKGVHLFEDATAHLVYGHAGGLPQETDRCAVPAHPSGAQKPL